MKVEIFKFFSLLPYRDAALKGIRPALALLCILIVWEAVVTYGAMRQKPFSDDWMMLEIAREMHGQPFSKWITVTDYNHQWRPLTYMFQAAYLRGQQRDLTGYNLFKMAVFFCSLYVCYLLAMVITQSKLVAVLAVLLLAVNPSTIGAVQNIDHLFKITGALFYLLSCWCLIQYGSNKPRPVYLVLLLAVYALSFLSDADSVAICVAIFFLLPVYFDRLGKKTIGIAAVSMLMLVVYLNIRGILVGHVFGGGVAVRQQIVIGFNVLHNVILMLTSIFSFGISPYVYAKQPYALAEVALLLSFNVCIIGIGGFLSKVRGRMLLLLGLGLIAMIPFILIRHISEIYTLRATYFFMIILAWSIVQMWDYLDFYRRKILFICVGLIILCGGIAALAKQHMMLHRGLQATHMVISLHHVLPRPDRYSTIALAFPETTNEITYSDFVNTDALLVDNPDYFLRYNYQDSTLNRHYADTPKHTLCWSTKAKKFSLETIY